VAEPTQLADPAGSGLGRALRPLIHHAGARPLLLLPLFDAGSRSPGACCCWPSRGSPRQSIPLAPQPGLWHSAGLSLWVAGPPPWGPSAPPPCCSPRGTGVPGCAGCAACSPPAGASPRRLCHRHRLSDRSLRLAAAPRRPLLDLTHQPPDWQTLKDPWGLGLIVVLILKETPSCC
jgi:putative thiamine transport system permease protein